MRSLKLSFLSLRSTLLLLCLALVTAASMGACVIEETASDDDTSTTQTNTTNPATGGGAGVGGAGVGGQGMGGVQPPACDMWVPRWAEPEIIIAPVGLQQLLISKIDAATTSVELMMYQLYCQPCVSALINAKNRGVNVRVLLDYNQGSNNGAKSALQSAGVELKASPAEFNHAHAKVLIIDHDEAVVMSANMNDYSFNSERNYGVIDHDPQDVAQLLAIFDRDWTGQGAIDTSCTRLIISPLNARQRTLELINSAQTSLDFAVMYISDAEVKNAVKAKAAQGVTVRALFAMPEWIGENAATAAELKAAGVQTKYLYTYELHAKLVIADGVPMVGSENMSYNSLENNREIGLLVTEPGPAAQIVQQFETDWSQGVAAP